MKKDLILIGGGGHCKSCIDVIEYTEEFNIIGILDKKELTGNKILSYDIIGTDEDILKFKKCSFLITVGQIKSSAVRRNIYHNLVANELNLATVISPRAYVSKHASIGKGTIVMHDAMINSAVTVGYNCIINTKALIEHDTVVGNHCHISTAAVLNGNCKIGDDVFMGSNATLANQIIVTDEVIVGAGITVIKNINSKGIYTG
ncbi:acetyltransferase [Pedobacter montanisoli]|uniref:Acetyltransferase n=1 Tax=Pedobacter montanisoli TaxID=2923277 RepID=A0ABS9ZSE1_9SPHI|nr:acetyltransferase [Pedobacter montanisoli]MCJ0741510.1 acetyltransferase [Pedobacter montanisoli]